MVAKNTKKSESINCANDSYASSIGYYNTKSYKNVDECIDFCLEKAREDKKNANVYLQIIKHLLDKQPQYVFSYPQTYSPLTYTDKNKTEKPDWEWTKVYCDYGPTTHSQSTAGQAHT